MRSIYKFLKDNYLIKRNPISYARNIGVEVGEGCRFLGLSRSTFGSEPFLIRVGNHVTITGGVHFVTHDGGVWVFRELEPNIDVFGSIVIEDNVFVGLGATIMPNVVIGKNSVVGAGSLVTKDVLPNTIVGGVPAKFIKSIEDYKVNIDKSALYIRSKPYEEKKKILTKIFFEERD